MSINLNVETTGIRLAAHDHARHALVLTDGQNEVRIVGTVEQLRAKAQEGLNLSIPPLLPRPAAAPATPATSEAGGDDRLARLEAAVASLTEIARRAQRRGLI
jgi:hypothetical protein